MASSEEISRVELLIKSAETGDLNTIRHLLEEKGTNINSLNRDGLNALSVASGHNQESVVKYLLAKGAQVDLMTGGDCLRTRGLTALYIAAKQGNVSICKLLLEHGADRNLITEWGRVKDVAIDSDDPECIELLFDQDYSSINDYDLMGTTPLMATMGSGHQNSTKFLLEKGADYNRYSKIGDPTLTHAINSGGVNCMATLLDHVKSKETSESFKKYLNRGNTFTKETALHRAYLNGRHTEVEILLKYGADPTLRDIRGKTPKDLENAEAGLWAWAQMFSRLGSNDVDRKVLKDFKALYSMFERVNKID